MSKKKKTKSKKEEKHSAYSDIIPEKKKKIVQSVYEKQLRHLQIELVKLQKWIHDNKLKVVVILKGAHGLLQVATRHTWRGPC